MALSFPHFSEALSDSSFNLLIYVHTNIYLKVKMKQNLSSADHCVERSEDPHHCLEHRHFRTTSVPYGHMCAHHCPSLLLVNPMLCLEKMSLESLGFIIWLNVFEFSLYFFKLGASFSPDKNKM